MGDELRRTPLAAVLRWGFGAAVALALAAGVVSSVEVQRARREVTELVRTADRSTFLVGRIGHHISSMRAVALHRLVDPQHDDGEELATIGRDLEASLAELAPLLQPEERRRWRRFSIRLVRFRQHLQRVLSAIEEGAPATARTLLLGRVTPLVSSLHGDLDKLIALNERQSQTLLAVADGRLARTRALEGVLAGVLVVGLAVIWWAVSRTLGRQERELARHVARVEASNRDLDAFAGRIAHDLRNALAPLGIAATTLRQASSRPDIVARIAGQLERTLQRSRVVMDGLLAFSRGRATVGRLEPASLRKTIAGAVDELAPLAERVDAALEVEVDDAEVACPPGLLHLVAVNLIGNALKFVETRPVRRVRVVARPVDGRCELLVEDTGPGIVADALPRIFEPFYRVPGTVAVGTGVGLATVERIVAAHGGTIRVESTPGRGSVFRVQLALHDGQPPVESPAGGSLPATPGR
jgi:signal transduction histidine kinase